MEIINKIIDSVVFERLSKSIYIILFFLYKVLKR